MAKTISIVDWFDPHNEEHIEAWKYLQDTNLWPEGFIPKYVERSTNWYISLLARLADAYLEAFDQLKESEKLLVEAWVYAAFSHKTLMDAHALDLIEKMGPYLEKYGLIDEIGTPLSEKDRRNFRIGQIWADNDPQKK